MRILLALFLTVFLFFPAMANCDPGEVIIKFGTYSNADFLARDKAAILLRDTINREMQGQACLAILSDEQRFKGAVGVTTLQNGEIQMMATRFQTLGRFSTPYRIFELPFAFRNLAAVEKFQSSSAALFITLLAKNGLQPLGFWHESFNQIAAKRAVYLPTHVAGLRFRTGGASSFRAQINALNATSQSVAGNDLVGVLKAGKLDAHITKWSQLRDDGTMKLLDGVSETNHGFTGYQLLVAKQWWNDLPAPLRKSIAELVDRISRQANFSATSRANSAKLDIIRSGVPVRALTRTQRGKWKLAFKSLWNNFSDRGTKPFLSLLKKANSGL